MIFMTLMQNFFTLRKVSNEGFYLMHQLWGVEGTIRLFKIIFASADSAGSILQEFEILGREIALLSREIDLNQSSVLKDPLDSHKCVLNQI